MLNSTFLRLYTLGKITNLQRQSETASTVEEVHRLEGKLEILQELFDDLNLKVDPTEVLEFHNEI